VDITETPISNEFMNSHQVRNSEPKKEIGIPEFLETPNTGSARCVDGRPDFEIAEKGPQMLGGSLHPILLRAIYTNQSFNESFVKEGITELQTLGFKVGIHRGDLHTHTEKISQHHAGKTHEPQTTKNNEKSKSGCGAADETDKIIAKAIEQKAEITRRLKETYEANIETFGGFASGFAKPFEQILAETYEKIGQFGPEKIKITGEETIITAEKAGAAVENLEGNHAERVAYVNLKKNITYDTNESNKQGIQAFNLDLLEAVEQAEALGVDKEFAIAASLILYQATEMVLVEEKGKNPLPILLHA